MKHEEKDQHEINPGMIFTNKFFYNEGIKLVYGSNTFIYSKPWTNLSYLSLPRESCAQECPMYTSFECKYEREEALRIRLENLSIRLPMSDPGHFLQAAKKTLYTIDRCQGPWTLGLDFLIFVSGYRHLWDENEDLLLTPKRHIAADQLPARARQERRTRSDRHDWPCSERSYFSDRQAVLTLAAA